MLNMIRSLNLGRIFSLNSLVFLMLLIGSFAHGGTAPSKRIFVGESFDLNLPGVRRIRLSREGIVYVRPGQGDLWRFTGVAKGVVIMHPQRDPENPNNSEAGAKNEIYSDELVVEVQSRPIRNQAAMRRSVRSKVESQSECTEFLSMYEAFEFVITMQSARRGESSGMKSRLDVELNGTIVSRSSGSSLAAGKILSRLADESAESRTRVLSRPRMVLAPGRKTTLKSGGEFKVDAPVLAGSPSLGADQSGFVTAKFGSWKEFGLVVSATWLDCASDRARVEYDVSLLQRSAAGSETLASGRVTGVRAVPLERWVFGGAIDFASGSAMKAGSSIFSGIPIIGPLLLQRDHESGDSDMVVWLRGISQVQLDGPRFESYSPVEGEFGDGTAKVRK